MICVEYTQVGGGGCIVTLIPAAHGGLEDVGIIHTRDNDEDVGIIQTHDNDEDVGIINTRDNDEGSLDSERWG